MKRILIPLGLSALTLVGGHFVNRRWDRALLLFVVLVLWAGGAYFVAMARVTGFEGAGYGAALWDIISLHWKIFIYGVVVLWVVSLIVTFLDARRSGPGPSDQWTVSGVIGAIGLSALTIAVFLMPSLPLLTIASFTYVDRDLSISDFGSSSGSIDDRIFSKYVYLGRSSATERDLGNLPSGDGYLIGRFTYEGAPASGVSLTLVLNGKYETERLTTDNHGLFTLRLPSGKWTVNRLITQGWSERPNDESVMIVSGTEPKLGNEQYDRHYWLQREGIEVEVSNQPRDPQLTFIIREHVALIWPQSGGEPAAATLESDVIAWVPYPDAATYLVQITELERDGRRTLFHPVTAKRTEGATQFALADLAAVPGNEEKEYQVSVLAFANDGTFLSESSEHLSGIPFFLTDKQQLVRDEERRFASKDLSTDELQQIRNNGRRIDAIEVLLKDDLLDEAEAVFGKIKGKVSPSKKAAIEGYLMAKRGRCNEAKRLFAKALEADSNTCLPECYQASCPE